MSEEFELNIGDLRRKRKRARGSQRNFNGEQRRDSRWQRRDEFRYDRMINDRSAPDAEFAEAPARPWPFDPWRLLEAVRLRWHWIALGGGMLALVAFAIAYFTVTYTVNIHLIRRETSNAFGSSQAPEGFKPRELSPETVASFMKAPELLRRVSSKASKIGVTPKDLAKTVKIIPTANPDIMSIQIKRWGDRTASAELANVYADEVIQYTRELQAEETSEIKNLLTFKIALADRDLEKANAELISFARETKLINVEKETEAYLGQLTSVDLNLETAKVDLDTMDLRIAALEKQLTKQSPVADKLAAAREKLDDLLRKYTEAHPLVQSQRLELAALEKQATAPISLTNLTAETKLTGNTFANTLALQILELQTQKQALAKKIEQLQKLRETVQAKINGLSEKGMRYALIKSRADSLENLHSLLSNRQREAQLFEDNALGYFKIFTRATPGSISLKHRWIKVAAITAAGCLLGLFLTLLAVLIAEITDTKLKTAADLERVTRLPVLATLGDLKQMDPSSQVSWAFRTLTLLKGKLSRDNDQGLVCGFISAHHGEGRSTWINLLVSAASQRGLRVLTVATRPSAPEADMESEEEEPVNGASAEIASQLPAPRNGALTPNFLACPGEVTEQLKDPNSQPVVHIPLPGWVWNLERRKQWQSALAHWRQIDNLVLLVELPPASQPESILLAENVPQLIWLTSSGMADAGETNTHLETLRHARCNLVGAVLNREPASFWKTHVSRWLRQAAAVPLLVSFLTVGILAQEKSETATQQNQEQLTVAQTSPDTPLVFSGANAPKRAAWQQRLTVGPGDALDFSLFGYPELTRTNLFIGPDGRITYLQAQDVPAVGLTIDELRARFDEELSKYYRAPKTIITPVAFHSKKYFVLGKVNLKGAFVLDRPITVLEAVARAKGLETGLFERSSVELADLSRSFLIRNGQRIPLNFERLFFEGDLSQNTMLEPGDYLYFPSTSLNEIYVLGEVMSPGILGFTPQSTLIAAISIRGGFTPKAYKKKILVVRGSLNQPEAHIVDAGAILEARQPDFKLQQKDIVYISKRPWAKVEELLDEAGQAFLEAMVAAWTGLNVGPIITRPITPQL